MERGCGWKGTKFNYEGVMNGADEGLEEELNGTECWRERRYWRLGRILKEFQICRGVQKVIIPVVLYGSETWELGIQEKSSI